jgi:hypothetical protein
MNMQDPLEDTYIPTCQEANCAIRVLAVCADATLGSEAIEILHPILRRTTRSAELQFNLWQFDLLNILVLRDTAAAQAARADFVIVAARDHQVLPPQVGEWMESWIHRRVGFGAMISVVQRPARWDAGSSKVRARLRQAAARAGMGFFGAVRAPDTGVTTLELHGSPGGRPPIDFAIEHLTASPDRVARCWGINE